ncbi:MAG: TIGR03936 family radical SAM-associated protein [Lachnospiraceae bacterium]|nr:TIGR03936 family radical SAM-associated protein [Lachnospiraceae bacterium]
MKLRIKYAKYGSLKFIGHLDVMRFFQKAIRRAGLDVAYSQGFSPHELITFAAPLGLSVTSEGEYFDGEFNSVTTTKDMVKRLNEQMVEGMEVLDVRLLKKEAKTAMAVVSASDYVVYIKSGYLNDKAELLFNSFDAFMSSDTIEILKKSKKTEKVVDIKPMIIKAAVFPFDGIDGLSKEYLGERDHEKGFFMFLKTGSEENLKPELVMEAYCKFLDIPYEPHAFSVHRLETYMNDGESTVPLYMAGEMISDE